MFFFVLHLVSNFIVDTFIQDRFKNNCLANTLCLLNKMSYLLNKHSVYQTIIKALYAFILKILKNKTLIIAI